MNKKNIILGVILLILVSFIGFWINKEYPDIFENIINRSSGVEESQMLNEDINPYPPVSEEENKAIQSNYNVVDRNNALITQYELLIDSPDYSEEGKKYLQEEIDRLKQEIEQIQEAE